MRKLLMIIGICFGQSLFAADGPFGSNEHRQFDF